MVKNKIARKLALYFAGILLSFSIIIGLTFIVLFRQDTVNRAKNDLRITAESTAASLGFYMANTRDFKSVNNFATYLRLLSDTKTADIWVVDDALQLYTAGKNSLSFKDLPSNAGEIVFSAFGGQTVSSEAFSTVLNNPTITIGTPIMVNDYVAGVLLVHSPISGIEKNALGGIKVMFIGILAALGLSSGLSVWLSKNFTDPIVVKEAQEQIRLEKLRRDYVANISHELKTPVTVLRGSLEALVDGIVTEPEDIKEYHSSMLNETIYLQRMVGDLLDLSRLQNPDFVMESQLISMKDVLEDALRSGAQLAESHGIVLSLHCDEPKTEYNGDFGRLRQMFLIILDNAVKFSKDNGKIDISFVKNCITITDYGCGIDQERLPYIFQRFYKSTDESNKSGTGLGLAIAREIAVRHGIKISVQSEKDQYTTFSFVL